MLFFPSNTEYLVSPSYWDPGYFTSNSIYEFEWSLFILILAVRLVALFRIKSFGFFSST